MCKFSEDNCEMCKKIQVIDQRRKEAKRKQEFQAKQMVEKSNKRFKPAVAGENVNVPVPDFTAIVKEHNKETGLYTLGTKVGTLDTQFSRNQFDLLPEKFIQNQDVPENVVGVREAARLHSNNGGQRFFKCSCQTKCQTKRCRCFKESRTCNSRCHKNRSCSNHDNPLV